jgi:hypothetical protein
MKAISKIGMQGLVEKFHLLSFLSLLSDLWLLLFNAQSIEKLCLSLLAYLYAIQLTPEV